MPGAGVVQDLVCPGAGVFTAGVSRAGVSRAGVPGAGVVV